MIAVILFPVLSDEFSFDELIQMNTAVTHGAAHFNGLEIIAFGAVPNSKRAGRYTQIAGGCFSVHQRLMVGHFFGQAVFLSVTCFFGAAQSMELYMCSQ